MDESQVIELGQDAIWMLIKVSAPVMLVALVVGLTISLFQALTQIQEMTLTFVPKILTVFATLMLMMPFIIQSFQNYADGLFQRIAGIQ